MREVVRAGDFSGGLLDGLRARGQALRVTSGFPAMMAPGSRFGLTRTAANVAEAFLPDHALTSRVIEVGHANASRDRPSTILAVARGGHAIFISNNAAQAMAMPQPWPFRAIVGPSIIVNFSVRERGSPKVGRVSCVISASRKPFSLITSRRTSLKRQSVGVSSGRPDRMSAPFDRSRSRILWKSSCFVPVIFESEG